MVRRRIAALPRLQAHALGLAHNHNLRLVILAFLDGLLAAAGEPCSSGNVSVADAAKAQRQVRNCSTASDMLQIATGS